MIKSYLYMVTILTTTSTFCDTIHFTNSQHHLINSTNHTMYRVNVPGSKDITIIEADQINNNNPDVEYNADHDDEDDRTFVTSDQLVVSDGANRRSGTINSESAVSSKKTVYSPELLHKFLQDYSQKVHSAAESAQQPDYNTEIEPSEISAETIQEKLEAIAKLTQQMTTESTVPVDEHFYNENENETVDQENGGEDNIQEKYGGGYDNRHKKYQNYNQHSNQHDSGNRYNDRDGWVTLDAIPWSSSKVSKWHPNNDKVTHFAHVSPVLPQWGDDPDPYDRPRPRPPSSYEPFPPSHDDEYYKPRPRPDSDRYDNGYDSLKPPSYFNDNDFKKPIDWNSNYNDDRDIRPSHNEYPQRPKPTPDYYQHRPTGRPTPSSHPTDSWYNNNQHNQQSTYRPQWDDDLVTDGRPSNFPSKKPYDLRPPPPRPSSSYNGGDDKYQYYQATASQHHPQTHPSNGNGEWVLISTTKGYHFPPKHGKRAMGFHTANGSAEKTQTIRLAVLPAASSTNQKFSPPTRNGSSIEKPTFDAIQQPVIVTAAPPAAATKKPKVKYQSAVSSSSNNSSEKNRKKIMKGVPLSSRNSGDSSAVLAAVGAGMVPATVAMLMPMVLGRKKRHIDPSEHKITHSLPQQMSKIALIS